MKAEKKKKSQSKNKIKENGRNKKWDTEGKQIWHLKIEEKKEENGGNKNIYIAK